ncbi:hypothetical protein CRG98_006459 [Punica granatum]|uniref:Uncharacterized protein n=1 Tax=Punica granatum TaxID=22663 RepID=A0A2I0KXF9_PUNGR|nr:hypothetical protein CRG98_006459 [Punica granatum]
MQTQDMLSEADNFALVICNEQNRLSGLIWTRSISPRKVIILGSFNSFSHVYRQFDVQFEPRTSNTQPIETRAFSRFLLLGRGTHGHLRGSVRSQEPLTLPQNSIGSLRGDVRPYWCQTGPKFQTCSVFRDLCRAVQVDSITLGPNYHHSHFRGSVKSQDPLTLPQNSIGSLRGDVRPDLCQSGLFSFQPGLLRLFGSVQGQNSPNPTQQRSNPTFCSPISYLGISWEEHPDPGKAKSSWLTLHERWPNVLLLLSGKERSSWPDPSSIPEFPRVFLRA